MFEKLSVRIRNTLKPAIRERLFFLHVPKCGGSSIRESLRRNYLALNCKREREFVYVHSTAEERATRLLREERSPEFRFPEDGALRVPECLLLYHMSQSHVKCIVGHVPFSEIAYRHFSDEFAFVTILRDPVERWISEYFYNRSTGRSCAAMTLEEYLVSPLGKAQGTQYVLYLGGRTNGNDHRSRAALQRALNNLERFAVIGFLEDLAVFEERFERRFGARLEIGRKNVTAPAREREEISGKMRKKIEEICAYDREIYEQARSRFL